MIATSAEPERPIWSRVGVIVRYAALTWRAIRGHAPDIALGQGSAL